MKVVVFLISFLLIRSHSFYSNADFGANGCMICTLGIHVFQQFAEWHTIPCETLIEDICELIPQKYEKAKKFCEDFLLVVAPVVCKLLEEGVSPDITCRTTGFCTNYKQCTLFPEIPEKQMDEGKFFGVKEFVEMFLVDVRGNTGENVHVDPLIPPELNDVDGDWFSTYFYKRGTSWRGKDCDDDSNQIYPGRATGEKGKDYDCNGISGVDEHGKEYKELLCSETERRGIVAIGDSHCAHFRIPEQFFSPNISFDMFKYVFPLIENEADWPHLGVYGGFMNDTTGLTPGPTSSMYLNVRDRNRCNHRDYQNVCQNGVSSKDANEVIQYIKRDRNTDHPVILFFNMIGDDVCGSHADFDHMTTPDEFHTAITTALDKLDTFLPNNSHVVFVGLADGTFLYEHLHDKLHPIGKTYKEVYDYMNCLGNNPCWGWCNSNATVRKTTQDIANSLSDQYVKILKERNYSSFDMHYVDFRTHEKEAMDIWIKEGKDPKDFIEPFDGFHPSQWSNPLLVSLVYADLMKQDPTVFGDINPNNAEIEKMFGNQGGY